VITFARFCLRDIIFLPISKGHANFLDVLVTQLDISDDEEEVASPVQERPVTVQNEPEKNEVRGEHEEDDDEDTESDDWSECDSSDDEDLALVRTISGRPAATDSEFRAQGQSNSESTTENMGDYFQFDHPESTIIALENGLNLCETTQHGETDKKEAIVSVTVASATLTPLASPSDETAT
jgi:hypothetical protein